MKRMLAVAALLTASLAGPASAHQGDIIYPIYELPTSDLPDLHDGTLEDWEGVLPNASLDHNDFISWGRGGSTTQGPPPDPDDLAFRVFLAWHSASQRIYMAVERLDDVYMNEGAQLMIDGDHSGGQFWFPEWGGYSHEESMRLYETQAQIYSASPEEGEARLTSGMPGRMWMVDAPWADAGGFQQGDGPNHSVVEVAVTAWDDLDWHGPEVSKRSVLEAGKIVGFQVRIFDMDEAMRLDGIYVLALSTVQFFTEDGGASHDGFADNFVDGELIPCERGDCSGATTAVFQDSWGRIKASFRQVGHERSSCPPERH